MCIRDSSVDTRRTYATGLGDGGFMALRVGCAMADRVAAIATVSAALPKTMICLPSRPVPALFMDGTDDPIIPYNGGTYKPGQFHVLSAEDSAKAWAKFDRCGEKPAQGKLPAAEKGGKEIKTFTFGGCQDLSLIHIFTVNRAGADSNLRPTPTARPCLLYTSQVKLGNLQKVAAAQAQSSASLWDV